MPSVRDLGRSCDRLRIFKTRQLFGTGLYRFGLKGRVKAELVVQGEPDGGLYLGVSEGLPDASAAIHISANQARKVRDYIDGWLDTLSTEEPAEPSRY